MRHSYILLTLLLLGTGLNLFAQTPVDTTIYLPNFYISGKYAPGMGNGEIKRLDVIQNPVYLNATTSEALRTIPSLVTDIEGGVTYRGSARPGTLIHGVPYGWMEEYNGDILIQLPAGFFDRLSISSFPPVNLIPDGEAGVLNLSSATFSRKNTPLQLQIGGGWNERYNAGVIINQHPGKFHINAKYNYRREFRKRTFRKITTTPSATAEMNNNASARPDIHLADLSIGYDITPKDMLSFYGLFQRMEYDRYGRIHNTQKNSEGEVTTNIYRHRNNTQKQDAGAVEARWLHRWDNPADHFEFVFNYNTFSYDEDNRFENEKPETGIILAQDDAYVDHDKKNFYFSGVLRKMLPANWYLATGYTGRVRNEDYHTFARNKSGDEWIQNESKSNTFSFDRQTHMLFAAVEKEFGAFRTDVGLQAEYSHRKAALEKGIDQFHLYPRIRLAYYASPVHDIIFSYQQRVIRPNGSDLNPFIDTTDATHIIRGNPDLKEEFIHSMELTYNLNLSTVHFTPVLYYRNRSNRIMETVKENEGQTIWQKDNIGNSQTVGGELAVKWNPIQKITLGLSGNIYRDEIDGRQAGYEAKKSLVCGDVKGMFAWALTPTTEFQADAFYVSDQLTPQGKIKSRYSVNAGITQYLLGRKLITNLSIQNIFDSLEEVTVIHTEQLKMRQERNRDARIVWLSLAYRL